MSTSNEDEQFRKGREYHEFAASLGMAIVAWQYVETCVFWLYARLIRSQNPSAMSAMYHSVVNFQARLAMVDEAMRATLVLLERKALLVDWERLHRRVKKAVGRRNDFVHFQMYDAKNVGSEGPTEPILHSSVFDTRDGKEGREYTTNDIQGITSAFIELKKDLDIFAERLAKIVPRPSLSKRRAPKSGELFD